MQCAHGEQLLRVLCRLTHVKALTLKDGGRGIPCGAQSISLILNLRVTDGNLGLLVFCANPPSIAGSVGGTGGHVHQVSIYAVHTGATGAIITQGSIAYQANTLTGHACTQAISTLHAGQLGRVSRGNQPAAEHLITALRIGRVNLLTFCFTLITGTIQRGIPAIPHTKNVRALVVIKDRGVSCYAAVRAQVQLQFSQRGIQAQQGLLTRLSLQYSLSRYTFLTLSQCKTAGE